MSEVIIKDGSTYAIVQRVSLAWMYAKLAIKSLFGPKVRYQVVLRVRGKRDDVVLALDALKKAYE